MRQFLHVSASQIDSYLDCNRMWWFNKILGLPGKTRASAILGGKVHKILEKYLLDGTPPDTSTLEGRIAASGIQHLPPPGSVKVEWSIDKNPIEGFSLAGLPIKGFIDVFDPDQPDPMIIDHKTTSDMKWAKDKRELETNVQLTIYARYAVLLAAKRRGVFPDKVRAGHVVYATRGAAQSRKTMVLMTPKGIEERWAELHDIVGDMRKDARVQTPGDVKPNTSSCEKYGGCAYRDKCKLLGTISAPEIPSFILKAQAAQNNALTPVTHQETPTMSENPALAALARLRAGADASPPVAPPKAATPPPAAATPPPATSAKVTVNDPLAALRALSASGAADEVKEDAAKLGDPTSDSTPEASPEAPANGSNGAAEGASSILAKFGLGNVGVGNAIVPPDAAQNTPTNAAVAAAKEEEKEAAAAATAPTPPDADDTDDDTDDGTKTVRRPPGYRKKLEALNYTAEMIDNMDPARMRDVIDNQTGPSPSDFPHVGYCGVEGCGTKVYEAPPLGGSVCENGHGGALVLDAPTAANTGLSEEEVVVPAGGLTAPRPDETYGNPLEALGRMGDPTPEPDPAPSMDLPEPVGALEALGRLGDPAAALGASAAQEAPPGLVVYVDCMPVKGRDMEGLVLLEEMVQPYMAEAAKMNAVTHYGLIEFGKGPQYVAAFVLANPPQGVIVANTRYPATGAILEILLPMADVVVRAAR